MQTIKEFTSIEKFSTDRLYARKPSASDLETLISMDTNPEVMKTLGGMKTSDETKAGLDYNLKHWRENHFGAWMFYLKENNAWVGRAALRRVKVEDKDEIEVGYALMPEYWHKGLATEIAKACCEIAFEVLCLENIVCFTLPTNKASIAVMEKAGFVYEKNITHASLTHVLYRQKNPRKVIVVPYQAQ